MRRLIVACLALGAVVAASTQLFAAEPQMDAAADAASYINAIQNTDGGFPGFSASSSPGSTLDAVFALSAAGVDPKTVTNAGNGPDDYLAAQAAAFSASSPGSAAKLVQGVLTMNLDETNFGSINPMFEMQEHYTSGTGVYGADTFAQSQYMLALDAAGLAIPPLAVTYLASLQLGNGSWEYCCGFGGDTNTTALAIRALTAGGVLPSDPDIVAGLGFLAANQEGDGGFPYLLTFGSEPNSTGFVTQALVAVGENIDAGGPWDKGVGLTPQAWLLGHQDQTTGALEYFGNDDAFATYQGLPGLTLAAFPEQADVDGDGLLYGADNCATVSNAGQANSDSALGNGPTIPGEDGTRPNSDALGDACDQDIDNDGRADTDELSGTGCGGAITDASDDIAYADGDPPSWDSDGDSVPDGPECMVGTDPTVNLSSHRTACATFAGVGDSDGDGLQNAWEMCKWGTSPTSSNSDDDGLGDCVEAMDVNGSGVVNATDSTQTLQHFFGVIVNDNPFVGDLASMDVNGNGQINATDATLILQAFFAINPCL